MTHASASSNKNSIDHQRRVVDIDGTLNFRDIGGYKTNEGSVVKWGLVYRSAQLDRLSERGVKSLADLQIKTVVDLRFSEESARYPTIAAAVPKAQMLSWHDEWTSNASDSNQEKPKLQWNERLASMNAAQVKETMRVNYPTKLYSHANVFKKMLASLAQEQTPLLFHCAAGKDRTGIAAALILSLLGVDDEQIIEDYLLTQQLIEGRMETWLTGGATNNDDYENFQHDLAKHPKEVLAPLFYADISYIETLLDYVSKNYGTFNQYAAQKLGLDDSFVAQLKLRLLE